MLNKRTALWIATFVFSTCIFLALSFKLPYTGRSLIGNFDPFPDTFYYVVPSMKFVTTGKFETSTQFGKVKQAVPPLYGVSLIPGYALNHDPRTYYFTNMFFGVMSIGVLMLILKKATKNALLLTTFGTLLYVTSYGIYWQPQLAMAENLLVLLLLLSLYVWQKKLTWKTLILLTMLAWSLFATKYVAVPLSIGWMVVLAVRIWQQKNKKMKWQQLAAVVSLSLVLILITTGLRPVQFFWHQVSQVWASSTSTVAQSASSTIWFSPDYLSKSFPAYGAMLLGQPVLHLWSDHRLVPPFLLIITLIWGVLAVTKQLKNQRIAWALLVLGMLQFVFLSMIEMVQSRYAYVFIPLVIVGTTLALYQLQSSMQKKLGSTKAVIFAGIIACSFHFYHLYLSLPELKTQLLVNRYQSEVAWWREGLVLTDQKFASQPAEKKRIIITALPPFLWEMYASKNLTVLPLNEINYFANEDIWAARPAAGRSWLQFYQSLVENPDIELYISTSGFTGGDYDHFQSYKDNFILEPIMSECNSTCKIYRLRGV